MASPKAQVALTGDQARELAVTVGTVLQPRSPIAVRELFAGRWDQLTSVADAVGQRGLHVAIYGERGVGKTSLANVVKPTIQAFDRRGEGARPGERRLVVKANANIGDHFAGIWDKLFAEINWADERPQIGFTGRKTQTVSFREAYNLPDILTINDVKQALRALPGSVFIIDEFDRAAKLTSMAFTDLIKALCDFDIDSTIILVGVSDTVDQLVADHASIQRALTQVLLPRMTPAELDQILSNAEKSLEIGFSEEARRLVVHMSQGLPHYTHLIGVHAVRKAAIERNSALVERQDVFRALQDAGKQAEQTVTERHGKAIHSAHKDALYRHVLIACALAASGAHDALGYFSPASIVRPLETVLGRTVEIATFNNHLTEFCKMLRGSVLERTGRPRAYRYRFQDPLVVPFVLMDAVANGLLSDQQITDMMRGAL